MSDVVSFCVLTRDLIKKLLVHDRTRRLGSMKVHCVVHLILNNKAVSYRLCYGAIAWDVDNDVSTAYC